MLFALDICVNKKAALTYGVHWGLNPTSKTSTPFFLPNPLLNLRTIQAPCLGISSPIYWFFMHPALKIGFFSELP